MEIKEEILEALEGKRAKRVWKLIERAIKEIYKTPKKFKIPKHTKEEYFEYEDNINNEKNRYIIIEHYNIEDGFYCRFYSYNGKRRKKCFEYMLDDYFSDGEGWERILLVDMKEMKCYLLDKKVSYPTQEIKIKI